MSIVKAFLIAAGLVAGASAAARAGEGSIDTNMAFVFNASGHYLSGKVNSKGMAELMKGAKALPGGVSIVRSKGKLYVVEDPKGTLYQMARDKTMF
ncbi:MAG: hypothetical protein IRZ09_06630 [Variibacter sp.]|nr:hypothetical protein [Variibacter sp.]